MDEVEARKHGDSLAEDIHHYRHMLITAIRDVYADVSASEPKKYTYEDWSYFLQLLGEDEGDSKYHRKAPMKPKKLELVSTHEDSETAVTKEEKEQNASDSDEAGQKHAHAEEGEQHYGSGIKQWSWMGNRSPLMGDKDEAEWILEKLFRRLEEELQEEKKLAAKMRRKKEQETGEKQETPKWPLRPVEDRPAENDEKKDGNGSGDSAKTLDGESDESGDSRPSSADIRQSGLAHTEKHHKEQEEPDAE